MAAGSGGFGEVRMGNERFRVGVIGTSWWADLEHLPGLCARRDVELVSLCGRNPERLAALAAKFGVPRTCTEWRAMISGGGLDVLVIATPNSLHHPQAMAALEAGLHVICEKPLAMNVTLAREMAARAEAARRKTLTFFTHRTVAAAAQVKRMVDEGFLGKPLHVSGLYFTASHLRENKPFAWKPDRPGLELIALPRELAAGLDTPDNQADRNEAYRRLTDPFFAAIRDGGTVSPDFRDGAAVQAVLDAVAGSAEAKGWVSVR